MSVVGVALVIKRAMGLILRLGIMDLACVFLLNIMLIGFPEQCIFQKDTSIVTENLFNVRISTLASLVVPLCAEGQLEFEEGV